MAKEKNLGKLKSRFEVRGGLINEYDFNQNQGAIAEEEHNRFQQQSEEKAEKKSAAKKATKAAKKSAGKSSAGKSGGKKSAAKKSGGRGR